jgi:single-strand DNA-binding protein
MYQKMLVIGFLGGDPVMKYTPEGVPVTDFSVATNRKWKGADGELKEKTTWFRVTAWRKLAETCNTFLRKGKLVLVEGEVEASPFLGQDGQPKASLKLTASNVRFLGTRGEEASHPTPVVTEAEPAAGHEEELPF